MIERPVGWYDAKRPERIEECEFITTHPNFGSPVEVICKNCVYYDRVSMKMGKCRVNPPVVYVDRTGEVQSATPETSEDSMCARFFARK